MFYDHLAEFRQQIIVVVHRELCRSESTVMETGEALIFPFASGPYISAFANELALVNLVPPADLGSYIDHFCRLV